MAESRSIELTDREARLLFNTIRARAIYKPMNLPLGTEIWQPWMEELLQKLQRAVGDDQRPR
jgi:hypothetical protein